LRKDENISSIYDTPSLQFLQTWCILVSKLTNYASWYLLSRPLFRCCLWLGWGA